MIDSRITRDNVLRAIYSEEQTRRTIWSPCTTLEAMAIEWYPHISNTNRMAMKRVLEDLCAEGLIARRNSLHSHFTIDEIAYEHVSQTEKPA